MNETVDWYCNELRMMIQENTPARLLNVQLEELVYGKLYEAYSSKGRKSTADPQVLFKVLVRGYLCGIYSSRKLEEACQYRIDFRWLVEDRRTSDHSYMQEGKPHEEWAAKAWI